MNKLLTVLAAIVTMFTAIAFFTIANESKAGIFDDITTAITGHIDDAKDRYNATDSYIDGEVLVSSSFRDDDPGQDFAHRGSGDVSIIKKGNDLYIQVGENFTTTPGPDYHIYISDTRVINDKASFKAARTIEVSKLKQGVGAHFYKLPSYITDEMIERGGSITVWCKAFGAFITSATIN